MCFVFGVFFVLEVFDMVVFFRFTVLTIQLHIHLPYTRQNNDSYISTVNSQL